MNQAKSHRPPVGRLRCAVGRRVALLAALLAVLAAGCAVLPNIGAEAVPLADLMGSVEVYEKRGDRLTLAFRSHGCPRWNTDEPVDIRVNGERFENTSEGPSIVIWEGGPVKCGPPASWSGPSPDGDVIEVVIDSPSVARSFTIRRPLALPRSPRIVVDGGAALKAALPIARVDGRAVLTRGAPYAITFDDNSAVLGLAGAGGALVRLRDHDDARDPWLVGSNTPGVQRKDEDHVTFYERWSDHILPGARTGTLEVQLNKTPILAGAPFITGDNERVTYHGGEERMAAYRLEVAIDARRPTKLQGDWMGACFPNDTCHAPLACVEGYCLD